MTRHVGADVLVTTPTDDAVHELSGGASAVWEELRTPRTVVDLVDRLASAHGAEPSDIVAEVEGCLDTLVRLKVVEEVQDFDG
jgi:hypothetical protein